MKRVILCIAGMKPKADWYPWIKKELEKNDITVEILKMPNPGEPSIEAWVPFLEKNVKNVDADTYLIGHMWMPDNLTLSCNITCRSEGGWSFVLLDGLFTKINNTRRTRYCGPWLTEL